MGNKIEGKNSAELLADSLTQEVKERKVSVMIPMLLAQVTKWKAVSIDDTENSRR